MVIFHSYVSLPEGTRRHLRICMMMGQFHRPDVTPSEDCSSTFLVFRSQDWDQPQQFATSLGDQLPYGSPMGVQRLSCAFCTRKEHKDLLQPQEQCSKLLTCGMAIWVAPRRVPPAPRLDANCAGQGRLFEVEEYVRFLISKHAKRIKKILKEAYSYKDVRIRIKLHRKSFALSSDAAWANASDAECSQKSQAGFIVLTEHMLRTCGVETVNLDVVPPYHAAAPRADFAWR